MGLEEVWFVVIGVLWSGYFLLEGFDFGVGMLLPILPRDERERGLMFESIGPVWDGNEVWLVVAAGATFAAFPAWYATLFSGFYVALLLILVLLIVRVVSFEWREKHEGGALADDVAVGEHDRERRRLLPLGSRTRQPRRGGAARLLARVHRRDRRPVHRLHGGRRAGSGGDVRPARRDVSHPADHRRLPRTSVPHRPAAVVPAIVLGIGAAAWTVLVAHDNNNRAILPTTIPAALTAIVLLLALMLTRTDRDGWAFAATGLGAIGLIATIFTGLYPGCSSRIPASPTA